MVLIIDLISSVEIRGNTDICAIPNEVIYKV